MPGLLLSRFVAVVALDHVVLVLEPLAAARLRTIRQVGNPSERLLGPFLQFARFQNEVLAAGFADHLVEVILKGLLKMRFLFERQVHALRLFRIRQYPHLAIHYPSQEIGADQVVRQVGRAHRIHPVSLRQGVVGSGNVAFQRDIVVPARDFGLAENGFLVLVPKQRGDPQVQPCQNGNGGQANRRKQKHD